MAARYEVKLVDLGTGERMPLLTKDGVGLFEPTAFALSMRTQGRKVQTLDKALRAVQFLYESLSESGVDLMARTTLNDLLTLGEVEGLSVLAAGHRSPMMGYQPFHLYPPKSQTSPPS